MQEISLRMVRPQSAVGDRRVQGHRQNTARHAACQLRPAQRQRAEALCWKLAARWLGAKEDGSEATVKIKGQTPAKEGQG